MAAWRSCALREASQRLFLGIGNHLGEVKMLRPSAPPDVREITVNNERSDQKTFQRNVIVIGAL